MIDLPQPGVRRSVAPRAASQAQQDAVVQVGTGQTASNDMLRPAALESEARPVQASSSAIARPRRSLAADSCGVAARSVQEWCRIEQALAPIIGHGGVGAVYGRSLTLARGTFGWLPAATEGTIGSMALARLHAALAGQPAAESAAADDAMQQTFRDVLASLLGAPLAGRLLASGQRAGDVDDGAADDPP